MHPPEIDHAPKATANLAVRMLSIFSTPQTYESLFLSKLFVLVVLLVLELLLSRTRRRRRRRTRTISFGCGSAASGPQGLAPVWYNESYNASGHTTTPLCQMRQTTLTSGETMNIRRLLLLTMLCIAAFTSVPSSAEGGRFFSRRNMRSRTYVRSNWTRSRTIKSSTPSSKTKSNITGSRSATLDGFFGPGPGLQGHDRSWYVGR